MHGGEGLLIQSTNYHGGLDQLRTRELPAQPIATFKETAELIALNSHVKSLCHWSGRASGVLTVTSADHPQP